MWTVRKAGDRYTGTAGDVVGEARGEAAGNALHWSYVLEAKPVDGETVRLDMDDWMWLIDERTLMNRTPFSKFGIGLGEVTFTFRKRDIAMALNPPLLDWRGTPLLDRRRVHRHRRGDRRGARTAWRARGAVGAAPRAAGGAGRAPGARQRARRCRSTSAMPQRERRGRRHPWRTGAASTSWC